MELHPSFFSLLVKQNYTYFVRLLIRGEGTDLIPHCLYGWQYELSPSLLTFVGCLSFPVYSCRTKTEWCKRFPRRGLWNFCPNPNLPLYVSCYRTTGCAHHISRLHRASKDLVFSFVLIFQNFSAFNVTVSVFTPFCQIRLVYTRKCILHFSPYTPNDRISRLYTCMEKEFLMTIFRVDFQNETLYRYCVKTCTIVRRTRLVVVNDDEC